MSIFIFVIYVYKDVVYNEIFRVLCFICHCISCIIVIYMFVTFFRIIVDKFTLVSDRFRQCRPHESFTANLGSLLLRGFNRSVPVYIRNAKNEGKERSQLQLNE